MQDWYLLMTKPREDERAERHLLNQGYEIYRPLIRQFKLKRGRQAAVTEPLFPRYIFILLDDVLSNWAKIRSTRGVAGMIRFADMPARVPGGIITLLKERCCGEHVLDMTLERPFVFTPGDNVEITEGSFRGIEAIVREQKGTDRVVLLLQMLGTKQTVEMPINQVKTIK